MLCSQTRKKSGRASDLHGPRAMRRGGFRRATVARAGHVRWYDPTVGRWLTEDPAAADANLYRYCGNAPTNGVDPSGLAEGQVKQPSDPIDPGWTIVKSHTGRGARGQVTWRIATNAKLDSAILFEMWFVPDKNCPDKQILNIQMIMEDTVGGKPNVRYDKDHPILKANVLPPGDPRADAIANYSKIFSTNQGLGNGPDFVPIENHIYYGVTFNGQKWVSGGREQVGQGGPNRIPPYMKDIPSSPNARTPKGDVVVKFESAVFCPGTSEVLGAVKWGYKIGKAPGSPIEIVDGNDADLSLEVTRAFKDLAANATFAKSIKHKILPLDTNATGGFGGTSALP